MVAVQRRGAVVSGAKVRLSSLREPLIVVVMRGACGRFFETEGIVILAMLISRYKIELPDEPEFAGESLEERRERVLRATQGITLT